MNRKGLVFGLCLTAIFAATAVAQESIYFFDTRPNDVVAGSTNNMTGTLGLATVNPYLNDSVNTGRKGAGTVLRLEPKHADAYETINPTAFPNHDADGNRSTGDLWLYADMNADTDPDSTSATTDEVLSSVGLDIDIVKQGTTTQVRGRIQTIAFTLNNDGSVFNSKTPTAQAPWNNKIDGAVDGPADADGTVDWVGIKAVRVPVATGPVYQASLGITPRASGHNDLPYRLGKLRLTAATRNCQFIPAGVHVANSTFSVFLKVNNLLVTRVFNGAGDNPVTEDARFGYNGAAVDAQAVNGNTIGATTAIADAVVEVRVKGDFTSDGFVSSADTAAYIAAVGAGNDNVFEAYCGDFTGDNQVTSADTGTIGTTGYINMLNVRGGSAGATCP